MNEEQKIKKKIKINEKALADGGKITAAAAAPNVLSSSVIKKNSLIVERKKVILINNNYLCYNSSSMLQKETVFNKNLIWTNSISTHLYHRKFT